MALNVEVEVSQWTQEDVDRLNAKRGATMPAHVGVRPGSPLQAGAGQTGATMSVTGKRSKYRNVRTTIGTETFDSKREADYWLVLKAREQLGEIADIKRQVPFSLMCPTAGDDEEVCRYVADFTYRDVNKIGLRTQLHVVDAKGFRTREYQMKRKWLKLQEGVTIEEV